MASRSSRARQKAIEAVDVEELAEIRTRNNITIESTLVGIARVAFADPRKLFDKDGQPLPIHELDDDTALAIDSIEVIETYAGSGEDRLFTGYVKKYRFSRRGEAQEKLMKHLNGYKDHEKTNGDASANAIVSLLEGMRRSTLPVALEVGDDHGV
jgi:phage terminase small subunit